MTQFWKRSKYILFKQKDTRAAPERICELAFIPSSEEELESVVDGELGRAGFYVLEYGSKGVTKRFTLRAVPQGYTTDELLDLFSECFKQQKLVKLGVETLESERERKQRGLEFLFRAFLAILQEKKA